MLTTALLNKTEQPNYHLEIILSSVLIAVIIIKIITRVLFTFLYDKTKDPLLPKNVSTQKIDYTNIINNYFQYYKLPIPIITGSNNSKKFKHYNIKQNNIEEFQIPKIINNEFLNGYNLDFILAHIWLFNFHMKHKIRVVLGKFIAYHAYDIFSLLFYILVLVKLIFLFSVEKMLTSQPIIQTTISMSLSTASIILFFISTSFLIFGIFIKHSWEKKYEKNTKEFVNIYFNQYSQEYQTARIFSKSHKFSIYFKPKYRKDNSQGQRDLTIKQDKYLGPFVAIKFRKWRHNQ